METLHEGAEELKAKFFLMSVIIVKLFGAIAIRNVLLPNFKVRMWSCTDTSAILVIVPIIRVIGCNRYR